MTLGNRQLWQRLFLPFAAGYFLSYLYRTANAVIGPVLARSPSDLGRRTQSDFYLCVLR